MAKNRNIRMGGMQFVTSCISTMLVLVLLGTVLFFVLTARNLSAYVRESINFSLLLSDDASEEENSRLQRELTECDYIKEVVYISKEQALEEQTEAMGTNPVEFLGYNPFTASMEVKLHADYANADSLVWIEQALKEHKAVTEIVYPAELMQAVNRNLRKISIVLLSLAAMLTLVSFALINNTIRLSIYAHRFMIHTMKLVGASWGFIRRPFIRRHLWVGLLAGLLADGLLGGAAYLLLRLEPQIAEVVTGEVLLIVGRAVLAAGVLITLCCAYLSINRYLRLSADELYQL